MAGTIIKYALNQASGNAIFIDDASNGLSCNCKCAKCGKRMEAIQGQARKREWHFRHYENSDCSGGQETAIHKLAKQIIVKNSRIAIPCEILAYTEARQEEAFLSVIPDVTVSANDCNVYFEITVTHGVDNSKSSFYSNGQYKSIEIDLTKISYDTSPVELKEIILQQVSNKRKIFWHKAEQPKEETPLLIKIGLFLLGLFLLNRLFSKK